MVRSFGVGIVGTRNVYICVPRKRFFGNYFSECKFALYLNRFLALSYPSKTIVEGRKPEYTDRFKYRITFNKLPFYALFTFKVSRSVATCSYLQRPKERSFRSVSGNFQY